MMEHDKSAYDRRGADERALRLPVVLADLDGTAIQPGGPGGERFAPLISGASLSWEVPAAEDGRYELIFGYRSPHADKAQVLSINDRDWAIGFPYTGETENRTGDDWPRYRRTFHLKSGWNRIGLRADWGGIEVGYLAIASAPKVPAAITPCSGVFYRRYPADIEVKVDLGGHILRRVAHGGVAIDYDVRPYDYLEDSCIVTLPAASLGNISEGSSDIAFEFDNGQSLRYALKVVDDGHASALTIAILDVTHGNSTFFRFPSGKTLLLDSGKEEYAGSVVVPFLDRHGVEKLDYYFLSHYHGDHTGLKDTILEKYQVSDFRDYRDFKSGDEFEFEGCRIKVLNAYADGDGEDDNSHSLSFRLEYNGFVYVHGADVYAKNQVVIQQRFPNDIRAHVYNANHHFHGSMDPGYLRATDPYLVVCSAEEAVYARPAYFQYFKHDVEQYQKNNGGRMIEGLLTLESGTVVVRADDERNWSYETYRGNPEFFVPYLALQS